MNRTTIIAVALAALIAATGFAAAAPGSAPVSVDTGADSTDAADHPANGNAQSADDRDNESENGTAAADERNGQGPDADLPEQVPDHVSAIHDRISSFLSGDLETSLGDAISDVTPDDEDAADEDDATESGDESDESDADEDSDADDNADEDSDADEDADADEDSTDDEQSDEDDESVDE